MIYVPLLLDCYAWLTAYFDGATRPTVVSEKRGSPTPGYGGGVEPVPYVAVPASPYDKIIVHRVCPYASVPNINSYAYDSCNGVRCA